MFWSYQVMNLLRFGVFALLARGSWLRCTACRAVDPATAGIHWSRQPPVAHSVGGQQPSSCWSSSTSSWRTDASTLPRPVELSPLNPDAIPPSVRFLNEQPQREADGLTPWRFTTFNVPGEKTFNANAGMYYDWQDIRGYDSTIPAQYAR